MRGDGKGSVELVRIGGPDGVLDESRLRELLGDGFERYAAGFDRSELTLAVLPRVLALALDGGAAGAVYIAGATEPTTAPPVDSDRILISPWPPRPGSYDEQIAAAVVPSTPAARMLLDRWAQRAAQVLDEDRGLTAASTLRWLRAFGETIPDLEIAPIPGPVPGAPTAPPDPESEAAYAFNRLPGGLPLTPALRRLLRRSPFPRPFTEPDQEAVLSWLREPVPVLPRYLAALADVRADLREQFGGADGTSPKALLDWARRDGRLQDPVLARVIDAPTAAGGAPRPEPAASGPAGVNVVGYWQAELGVADAARLLVTAMDAAGVSVRAITPAGTPPPSRHRELFPALPLAAATFDVNLLALNPDGLLGLREVAGAEFFSSRANIGYWWWEVVGAFPEAWRPALGLVQEVWVGSRHVRDAIAPATSLPVNVVPIPVRPLPAGTTPPRGSQPAPELPDGFLFLTMFDYNSAFERKNPLAAIDAFRRAFAPGSGASLLVKSINGDRAPDDRDELAIHAETHPDVHLLDGYMSGAEVDALLRRADCVVSLHRAEGFGIPLARALRSGIPVVATAYGGNLDFMTAENSFLVGYDEARVPAGTLYPAGAVWAEPDVEQAAAELRRVFEDPAGARARALRGASFLAEHYSPAATGAAIAAGLDRVRAEWVPVPTESDPAAQRRSVLGSDLPDLVQASLVDLGGDAVPAHALRTALERTLRPLLERQRAIDGRILAALSELEDRERQQDRLLTELESQLAAALAGSADLAQVLRLLRAASESDST